MLGMSSKSIFKKMKLWRHCSWIFSLGKLGDGDKTEKRGRNVKLSKVNIVDVTKLMFLTILSLNCSYPNFPFETSLSRQWPSLITSVNRFENSSVSDMQPSQMLILMKFHVSKLLESKLQAWSSNVVWRGFAEDSWLPHNLFITSCVMFSTKTLNLLDKCLRKCEFFSHV